MELDKTEQLCGPLSTRGRHPGLRTERELRSGALIPYLTPTFLALCALHACRLSKNGVKILDAEYGRAYSRVKCPLCARSGAISATSTGSLTHRGHSRPARSSESRLALNGPTVEMMRKTPEDRDGDPVTVIPFRSYISQNNRGVVPEAQR